MGLLDTIEGYAGGQGGGAVNAAQAGGGLVQEMEQRPGGLGGLLQSFQQNGLGSQVQQWSAGQTSPTSPEVVEQGLGGGLINGISTRTGMSPGMVKTGLAVLVPLLIHHMVQQGHVTPQGEPGPNPMPQGGGLVQSVLGHLL